MNYLFCCFKLKHMISIQNHFSDDESENENETEIDKILDSQNPNWLSLNGEYLKCKVIDIYDADTITIIIPFHNTPYKVKCRLTGIDSAEIRTKNQDEKKIAIEGKKWLINKILDKKIWIDCGDWDKYGRLLGKLFLEKNSLNSINDEIVQNGYAYEYNGKKKKTFKDWYNSQK